ncbi:MAG: hypothetical protein ABIR81_08250 [Ginsengibacter sp.]
MREFLKDGLEPLCYLLYTIAVVLSIKGILSIKKIVLACYYVVAAIVIGVACYFSPVHLNHILYNLFFFATISVLSYYFKSLVSTKTKRTLINIIFFINLGAFAYLSIVTRHLTAINNYYYAITYLSIVVYALLYFEDLLKNVNELSILHRFDFWLVAGYLLYFLSCFFIIFLYDNFDVELRANLWTIQNTILFISTVSTLLASIWIRQRRY